MKNAMVFVAGVVVGVVLFIIILDSTDTDPNYFKNAAQPLADARGIERITTASDLRWVVNPCIVKGPLPEACKPFVVDGVVMQPPIKIVLDTEK